jgi:hypothetical protein
LNGTRQRDLFSRHATEKQLESARQRLERLGLVENVVEKTGGRPRVVTFLCDQSVISEQSPVGGDLQSLRSLWAQRSPANDVAHDRARARSVDGFE